MYVSIILAGGTSSRFRTDKINIPKQLYEINGKPIVCYSLDIMTKLMDKIIVITNSECIETMTNIVNNYDHKNIIILINDVNCRLKSIATALMHLKQNQNIYQKVIIHDAARPFFQEHHIQELMKSDCAYAQYYFKLVNGLAKKTKNGYEIVDRGQYIELVTPFIIDFNLYDTIFTNYIDIPNRIHCEFIPVLDLLNIGYKMIEGSHKDLRKITTVLDLYL